VFDLIERLIQTLSSPEIAIDARHTPKLYARFLAGLLSRYHRNDAVEYLHLQPKSVMSSSSNGYGPSSPVDTSFPKPPIFDMGSSLELQNMTGCDVLFAQGEKAGATIYRPVPTYAVPSQFGADMAPGEDQMLAAMQALKEPAWWDNNNNMMMPSSFLYINQFGSC
jgi:hypothetical protein